MNEQLLELLNNEAIPLWILAILAFVHYIQKKIVIVRTKDIRATLEHPRIDQFHIYDLNGSFIGYRPKDHPDLIEFKKAGYEIRAGVK